MLNQAINSVCLCTEDGGALSKKAKELSWWGHYIREPQSCLLT